MSEPSQHVHVGRLWSDGAYTDRDRWVKAADYERLEQANTELRRELALEVGTRSARLAEIEAGKKRVAQLRNELADLKVGIIVNATDTVWYSDIETACDRIDAILLGGQGVTADPPSVIPPVLFDGTAVWQEAKKIRNPIDPMIVSDVLDAVVRLMRAAQP